MSEVPSLVMWTAFKLFWVWIYLVVFKREVSFKEISGNVFLIWIPLSLFVLYGLYNTVNTLM
ncbi:hypothetical protein EXU57_22955 [Segetibacter sp. 3557_3]|uniref:hypothetical protein n=1 Tax=Segetibacter sp. 3557_3 TaxID=2547429 RepID=UPI0010589222|nr:hypothetical protein [Segetibacter sp. 3557_3]TDH18464.1 hypothetical protein EXU57_22955 [Segetibacter sp. 3557_3]